MRSRVVGTLGFSLWAALTACGDDASDAGSEGAPGWDASVPVPEADAAGPGPCAITPESARCDSEPIATLDATGSDPRRVYWARPTRAAPARGYPAVVLYQGSIYGPSLSWDTDLPIDTAFGGYYQVALVDALVRHGFVVIQPEASGGLVWNTNSGGNYDTSKDAAFIPLLLERIADGSFGSIDTAHLYAAGISSGGYMTSRMAVSYPGSFRALAIESASYATCLGPLCSVPAQLPADHPPTLLLHGTLDTTVPINTARSYEERLKAQGIETRFVEDPSVGHAWLAVAPDEVSAWFLAH
jgi:predicted esterase